jgi:hypothetical protein
MSDASLWKSLAALALFLTPFAAAIVTARLGIKLRFHVKHHKVGLWLILLPAITFFWFVLIFFLLTTRSTIIAYLGWQVHLVPAMACAAIEVLLLRTLRIAEFRFHAIAATILCLLAAYVIFGLIFHSNA